MQILLLGVDKKNRQQKNLPGQQTHEHSPGALGAIFVGQALVFLWYIAGWQPGPAWLDLHSSHPYVIVVQTLLLLFVCWLCALVCSQAGYRYGRTAAQYATNQAIRWMLLYPGVLAVLLTLLLLIIQILHTHPWPAPLLATLLLLVLLRFWPQGFDLPRLLLRVRRPAPAAITTLVDLFALQNIPASAAGDEKPPPAPKR